jgi:hypothetical protein
MSSATPIDTARLERLLRADLIEALRDKYAAEAQGGYSVADDTTIAYIRKTMKRIGAKAFTLKYEYNGKYARALLTEVVDGRRRPVDK